VVLNLEVFLVTYLIGSIPTAYIVVRRKAHIDIRSAGTGNVGTMNAYEVTGSRFVGLMVLLGDVVKGVCAVLLTMLFSGFGENVFAAALLGVGVGHCFPVWLKFRGGRGLAPAAGAMLMVAWLFVAMWLVCWVVGYAVSKNIHVGNLAAIVVTPVLGWMLPQEIILKALTVPFSPTEFLAVYTLVSAVLFIRHIEPLRALLSSTIKNGK
jgi:glycerol-3-phosphate acyltransferase PlsY